MTANVVVMGAGPAGLATAACLGRAGVTVTVLEREAAVGSSWRKHYERLHLHTARAYSSLPGLEFPTGTEQWVAREKFVAYLEAYAAHHRIAVRFGTTARGVRRDGDALIVDTEAEQLRATHVVLATGNTRVPLPPTLRGRERFRGPVRHSAEYRNGEEYRGKRVLVIGFGNSGGEIAMDLHEHGAVPTLAVRSPVNVIPRDVFGVPLQGVGISLSWVSPRIADMMSAPTILATVGDIRKLGLRKPAYGPIEQIVEHGRIPLIDIGTLALVRAGKIAVRPGVRELDEDGVVFDDDRREPFDAILTATGYAARLDQLVPSLEVDTRGAPTAKSVEVAPGLYACGFRLAPTGVLREIGIEAQRIADHIARGRQGV